MRLVVVTGMSGAGKTQALKFLEDCGYYCIDNLPPALLAIFADLLDKAVRPHPRVAVGVDIRSGVPFEEVQDGLDALARAGRAFELLFLDCSDEVLIGRYKETRRAHPLGEEGGVFAAVLRERSWLQPLREMASRILDTSEMPLRDLRETLRGIYGADAAETDMAVTVLSFGFKHGLPLDADWVFDARFLPNPYGVPALRPLSGLMREVEDYVFSFPSSEEFLERTAELMRFVIPQAAREGRRHLVVAVGCTGGRHRSVVLARKLAERLSDQGRVTLKHRDIDRYDTAEAAKTT